MQQEGACKVSHPGHSKGQHFITDCGLNKMGINDAK